ncbi:MAG: cytochrome c biogenesis protein CcsA [Acidobacteria bacterium]|nr:cytochrome c biogenesis protein CcsA [Acidobacteriota bacterium]
MTQELTEVSNPGETTGSSATLWLGAVILIGLVILGWLSFVVTEADIELEDTVRIMYVHVPVAIMGYAMFTICGIGSAMVLWKGSQWWDHVAGAAGEIGVVFGSLTLATGMIWGRPTWGTYWEWGDVRLVTALMLVLLYVGYLSLRSTTGVTGEPSRAAAVVGLLSVCMIPVVSRSVEWWDDRTLHQEATVTKLDPDIDGLMLFTLVFGIVIFMLIGAWLLIHRFRVAHLETELELYGVALAVEQRIAETTDVEAALSVAGNDRKDES